MNNIAKGERVRFNIFDDLLLLREVIAVNPYENDSRWKDIRLSLNNASNKNFSLRALKEHVQHLLQLLNKEDSANLRKSGTEEQYNEKEQLLQEVKDIFCVYKYKGKNSKQERTSYHKNISARENATQKSINVANHLNMFDQCMEIMSESIKSDSTDDNFLENPDCETSLINKRKDIDIEDFALTFLQEKEANDRILKEKELLLQERKLELEEKKLKLEEEKFKLEKKEREQNLEIAKQQQSLIAFFLKRHKNRK